MKRQKITLNMFDRCNMIVHCEKSYVRIQIKAGGEKETIMFCLFQIHSSSKGATQKMEQHINPCLHHSSILAFSDDSQGWTLN